MRALLTLLFASLVLVPPVAVMAAPTPPKAVTLTPAQAALAARWVAAHGHGFDPGAIDAQVYRDIVAALGPARIYGLGEVTHGTHEDHQFKADLIKELIREGKIDTLALESNYTSGLAFDDYVKTGRGDPVALIRSTDFFRIWKGDEFASLLTWIRAWNIQAATPVSIVAVDLQLPGKDARIALGELATRDPAAAARWNPALAPFWGTDPSDPPRFSTAWTQISDAQRAAALQAGKELLARFDADAARQHGPAFARAHEAARRVWQGFRSYEFMTGDPKQDWSKVPPDFGSRRDRYMAENLLRTAASAKGVAFWAHNGHVVGNAEPIYDQLGFLTVGTQAKKALADGYRTVGFTYSTADVLITPVARVTNVAAVMPDDKVTPLANDRPGMGGALFARAAAGSGAHAMWLATAPLRGGAAPRAASNGDYFFGDAGWLVGTETFQKNREEAAGQKLWSFDVLVWFRHLTPQRRWPNVPSPK